MRLERILVELKQRKRALEAAIAALQAIEKEYRQTGTRLPLRTKRAAGDMKTKKRIPEIRTQTAVGSAKGQLVPFPAAKHSRRGRQRPEEVKA